MVAGREEGPESFDAMDGQRSSKPVAAESGRKPVSKAQDRYKQSGRYALMCPECNDFRLNGRRLFFHLVEAHDFDDEKASNVVAMSLELQKEVDKRSAPGSPPGG